MRTTTYEEIAAAAEREAPPEKPVQKGPAWTPKMLRARFEVRNRVNGNLSPLGIANAASLTEAREVARKRALSLKLPVFEVGPHEIVNEVAQNDGVYVVLSVVDEYNGNEIVRHSSLGDQIWKNAQT